METSRRTGEDGPIKRPNRSQGAVRSVLLLGWPPRHTRSAVDGPLAVPKRRRGPPGPGGNDLGADGDGRFLWGARSDVEPDRRHEPGQAVLADPCFSQPGQPLVVGPSRS